MIAWSRLLMVGFIVVILGSMGVGAVRAEPVLQVVEMAWTDGISESKDPLTIYNKGTAPAGKPLYLWIRVHGEQKALEKLKAKKKLTIIHKWQYNYLGWYTREIDVSIGRDQPLDDALLAKLRLELDTKGYFDWRTWSQKESFASNLYSVTIVDGFDDKLGCDLANACEMTIRLIK
jgi:hypothetical protein